MSDDWVFSFNSFDDPDEEGFDKGPISSSKRSVGTNGAVGPSKRGPSGGPVSRPQMTKEEQLKEDLDISTRADPAIFQKTPWTIAKLNALSRTKTTTQRHDSTIHPTHKSTSAVDKTDTHPQTAYSQACPPRSRQCPPPDCGTILPSKLGQMRQERTNIREHASNKFQIPSQLEEPLGLTDLATARSDFALVLFCKGGSDSISNRDTGKESHGSVFEANEPKGSSSKVDIKPNSLSFSSRLFLESNTNVVKEEHAIKPRTPPTRGNIPISFQKRKHNEEQENGDTKRALDTNFSKKMKTTLGASAVSPTLFRYSKNMAKDSPRVSSTAYEEAFYGTLDDRNWSTLPVAKKQQHRSKNALTTGVFKLPISALGGSRPMRNTTNNIPPRRTLLTIYQPPPPLQTEKNKRSPTQDQSEKEESLNAWSSSEDYNYGTPSSDNFGPDNIDSGSSGIGYENSVPHRPFSSRPNRLTTRDHQGIIKRRPFDHG
ncbi:hypothetical protein CPB86DRAFT_873757 [Serendipita vermifera]|nr:hypothetical protein CPB86DRAFT_873757 [Serendipita vermifera]